MKRVIDQALLRLLRCPASGQKLRLEGGVLINEDQSRSYRISESGIPLFAEDQCSEDARIQQQHYDTISCKFLENLTYPHTQVYGAYLDEALLEAASPAVLDDVVEVCCGRGEIFHILAGRVKRGIGVDVSLNMLEAARAGLDAKHFLAVQGDATRLPLSECGFDSVFMLGGIHHVNDRLALFSEIRRILRPGGHFVWREPVSDFFLWRLLRAVVYRLSPILDDQTESPLRYRETVKALEQAGLELETWRTLGFFGYCLFMNSDVLAFNRLFRFIPGIRLLARLAAVIDEGTIRLPGLSKSGLQVVGVARRPPVPAPSDSIDVPGR